MLKEEDEAMVSFVGGARWKPRWRVALGAHAWCVAFCRLRDGWLENLGKEMDKKDAVARYSCCICYMRGALLLHASTLLRCYDVSWRSCNPSHLVCLALRGCARAQARCATALFWHVELVRGGC